MKIAGKYESCGSRVKESIGSASSAAAAAVILAKRRRTNTESL